MNRGEVTIVKFDLACLSDVRELRHELFSEDAHLAQQVVHDFGLELTFSQTGARPSRRG